MTGAAGMTGSLHHVGLLLAGAAVAALVPSAHEIKNGLPSLPPIFARAAPLLGAALAVLAGLCVLEVGLGPPLNFIYFQF
jgi:hypothetical protein